MNLNFKYMQFDVTLIGPNIHVLLLYVIKDPLYWCCKFDYD